MGKPQTIQSVISGIGHTVLSLNPVDKPVALERVWCAFEVISTVQSRCTFRAAPKNSVSYEKGDEEEDMMAIWEAVSEMKRAKVNLEECQARDEQDKVMIMSMLEGDLGIAKTNALV